MPLIIYRRHSAKCEAALRRKGLKPEQTRYFQDCNCFIALEGSTDTEVFPRRALHTRDWKVAEAKLRKIAGESKDETVHGIKLSDAVQKYLDARQGKIGVKAHRQYKNVLETPKDFAGSKNKFFAQELDVDVLEDFNTYGFQGLKSTSKGTLQAKLNHFLREAYRRGWIKEPLVEKLTREAAIYEQKQPYSDEEVQKILESAKTLNGGTFGYATNGHTFRLLLELMLETGMRVGDAVRFNPALLSKSQFMWTYTFTPRKRKKTVKPKPVDVFLTERLKTEIETCKWFSDSLPFAYRAPAKTDETDYLAQAVYERMKNIGERCGIADCRPHRLRDTAAVAWLLKGMAMEDVSKLLGHASIAVTEKYYAAWVPSRKLRLEKLLFESLKQPGA